MIREADDRDTLLLGLVENVARENLSPIEEARGYALLLDEFELSLGEVSERVGRSKPAISNKLRLLELSDDVLAMVERGELTEGHARAVLAVPDQAERRRLARKIVAQGMSVRAAERAARWSGARTKPRTKTPVDPGARRAGQGRPAPRSRGSRSGSRRARSRSPTTTSTTSRSSPRRSSVSSAYRPRRTGGSSTHRCGHVSTTSKRSEERARRDRLRTSSRRSNDGWHGVILVAVADLASWAAAPLLARFR